MAAEVVEDHDDGLVVGIGGLDGAEELGDRRLVSVPRARRGVLAREIPPSRPDMLTFRAASA
jgi:hypothetical protein